MPTVRALIQALKLVDPDATAVLTEDAFSGAGEFVALDSLLGEMDDADEPASERELHDDGDEEDGEDALDHADRLADEDGPRMARAGGGYDEEDEDDRW